MRKIALVVVLLAATLCVLASGTERETVKVYSTARNAIVSSAQIWRCNRDGSEPELLLAGGFLHTSLAVDSAIGKLFYAYAAQLNMAELDGSDPVFVDTVSTPPTNTFAAESGYVCWVDLVTPTYVGSTPSDLSDYQGFNIESIPGMLDDPEIG
jgi:hypothetical protein